MTWSTTTIWKKKNDWGGVWERKWEAELREIQNLTARLGKMNLPREAKSRYSEANIGTRWSKQSEEYLEEKETVVWPKLTICMRACVLSRFGHVRLCDPVGCWRTRLLCPRDPPGKNAGMECHALRQGIFSTQGSNLRLFSLLQWQAGSFTAVQPGKPRLQHSSCVITIWCRHHMVLCQLPMDDNFGCF